MRVAMIAAACAAACSAMPVQAGVFLSFTVNATGSQHDYTLLQINDPAPAGATCLPGPTTKLCDVFSSGNRPFNFAQEFTFVGDTSFYDMGSVATTGRTQFTLKDNGDGTYYLINFKYDYDNRVVAPGPGRTISLLGFVPRINAVATPEPATWAMMLLGFGGMGYVLRRRAKTSVRIRFS